MASDHSGAPHHDGRRISRAGRQRSLGPRHDRPRHDRPRVEVHVNELAGTMSWRTMAPTASTVRSGRRTPDQVPRSARAAALRSAGLDPSRAPANGSAPLPTHPAAVRAALSVPVQSLGPEQLRGHLARVGALRSRVAADTARSGRMPAAVVSRLRSTTGTVTPAHTYTLTARRSTATGQSAVRQPAVRQPGPAAVARR